MGEANPWQALDHLEGLGCVSLIDLKTISREDLFKALRLFQDRLVFDEEQMWTGKNVNTGHQTLPQH